MTSVAKITAKGQTTIPADIRTAMHVGPGDMLAWEMVSANVVQVRRVQPLDVEYLHAIEGTLDEWRSPADEDAYRDL
jgi:AbrB family looped-hinge helix DNA binding protein